MVSKQNKQEPESSEKEEAILKKEYLSIEDFAAFKDVQTKVMLLSSKIDAAEAQAKYTILSIYMKYGLMPGKDEVLESGEIIRRNEPIKQEGPEHG